MSAEMLRERLNRIEALLGVVRIDELPGDVAERVEKAWIESRWEWPEDDPLRVAMLAKYAAPLREDSSTHSERTA